MNRCSACGRPRIISPLGQVCRASDPDDPGFHDFSLDGGAGYTAESAAASFPLLAPPSTKVGTAP